MRRRGTWTWLAAVGLLTGAAIPAVASANLPRTYQVQAIDNPLPQINDRFGDGLVNIGDLNADGEDDVLVGIDEHGTIEGKLHIFSGENGSLIRTIPPPDPETSGTGDNPAGFGTFVGKVGTNRSSPPFTDLGSCPGFAGTPGQDCTASQVQMDSADGVPDILASAIGVDIVDANGDDMGMAYVIDGATGAVLKRIRMPAGDRAAQATNSPTASQGPAFGRTIIAPGGQPPCAGFGGLAQQGGTGGTLTPCDYAATSAAAIGDVDGGGRPDIVIGASDYTDSFASNPACQNALNPGTGTCFQTGRFYVYSGEALAGLSPSTPQETPLYTLKNPFSQHDAATINSRFHREAMGYSVAPAGDLGKCSTTTIGAGELCLNTANTMTPDGRPDFIASSHRVDTNGLGDTGIALAIDGPTGRVLDVYNHPEPQQSAVFGFSNYNQPAIGDVGSSIAPDVYQGAMIQDVDFFAQGQGYVLSGDRVSGGANHYRISTLDDPTPHKIGNFGTSSAGVGDLVGDSRNEIAIGAYGPHAPQVTENVISDVTIFSPLTDQALQTISDPAQEAGSGFGRALAPMGDLNEDGFLDFAIGAGGFGAGTCSPCSGTSTAAAQGRLYLLRSDNSPAPAGPPPPGGDPPAPVAAGRYLEIEATKSRLRRPGRVRLSGMLEAFANETACEPGQTVLLQRRRPGRLSYATFSRATTNQRGTFTKRFRARRTFFYRARVGATEECLPSISNRERVAVGK